MESLILFTCEHAHIAHLIIFGMLMLAGLNVPLSEDILVLLGGYLASRCDPSGIMHWYLWIFVGCWVSAWEAYWIGRLFGPKLFKIRWFSHFISPQKVDKLHGYYEKFGVWTFIVGRFIPGGVRNALFMSSGLAKMPFQKFILRDGVGCLLSSATLFYLGFTFAESTQALFSYAQSYHTIVFILLGMLLIAALSYILYKRRANSRA